MTDLKSLLLELQASGGDTSNSPDAGSETKSGVAAADLKSLFKDLASLAGKVGHRHAGEPPSNNQDATTPPDGANGLPERVARALSAYSSQSNSTDIATTATTA